MRDEVRDTFLDWSAQFEGNCDWLYCDILGLVTTGIGLLVDPASMLAGLTFLRPDGTVATASEVSAAWLRVKGAQDLRLHGGGAYKSLTSIRVTRDSVQRVMCAKLNAMESILRPSFPDWDSWPAPAQKGALSMAWAMGPGFPRRFPRFCEAANAGDWAGAATACHMDDTENPGLRPRNAANVALFLDADEVTRAPVAANDDRPVFASPEPPDRDPEAA